jgi:hypothetical protein
MPARQGLSRCCLRWLDLDERRLPVIGDHDAARVCWAM